MDATWKRGGGEVKWRVAEGKEGDCIWPFGQKQNRSVSKGFKKDWKHKKGKKEKKKPSQPRGSIKSRSADFCSPVLNNSIGVDVREIGPRGRGPIPEAKRDQLRGGRSGWGDAGVGSAGSGGKVTMNDT